MTNKTAAKGKVDVTRRRLLLGMAAAPFFIHPSSWASTPSNPDVIIIGAGAAGLGAAKTLTDLGISFIMIEAQSRIGGRAYTDHHTFGVPYDMGCHWLNYGRVNPWFDYGKTFGLRLPPFRMMITTSMVCLWATKKRVPQKSRPMTRLGTAYRKKSAGLPKRAKIRISAQPRPSPSKTNGKNCPPI